MAIHRRLCGAEQNCLGWRVCLTANVVRTIPALSRGQIPRQIALFTYRREPVLRREFSQTLFAALHL